MTIDCDNKDFTGLDNFIRSGISVLYQEKYPKLFEWVAKNGLPGPKLESYKYTDLNRKLGNFIFTDKRVEVPDLSKEFEEYKSVLYSLADTESFEGYVSNSDNLFDDIKSLKKQDLIEKNRKVSVDFIHDLNALLAQKIKVLEISKGDKVKLLLNANSNGNVVPSSYFAKLAPDSRAVIIDYQGQKYTDERPLFFNRLFRAKLEAGSELTYIRIDSSGKNSVNLSAADFDLAKGSKLKLYNFSVGNLVSRFEPLVVFSGEEATADLAGIGLSQGRSHSDLTLKVCHKVPHCKSSEQFSFLLDGRSRSVFQGLVSVDQFAQQTEAEMSSKAVLINPRAEFNAKPELEIFADDVVCAHGATSGQLDEQQLFYLRSRGILEEEAKKLLVAGLVEKSLEHVECNTVTSVLSQIAQGWLSRIC